MPQTGNAFGSGRVSLSRRDLVQVNMRHAPRGAKRRQPGIERRYQPYFVDLQVRVEA